MKSKLIVFSDQEIKWVHDEAKKRETTFSDMVRRIVDARYENFTENTIFCQDTGFDSHPFLGIIRDGTNG